MLLLIKKSDWSESNHLSEPAHNFPSPAHVALIMDGNGRWAMQRGLPRTAGHLRGIRSVRRIVKGARAVGVQYLTLFAFSTENWQRSTEEVSLIMKLLERYLRREAGNLAKQDIRLQIIGERTRLPPTLQEAVRWAEQKTVDGMKMFSSPKIVPLAPALVHAFAPPQLVSTDATWFGKLFEASLIARFAELGFELFYWSNSRVDVDVVARKDGVLYAFEIKSNSTPDWRGLKAFGNEYPDSRRAVITRELGEALLSSPDPLSILKSF